MAAKEISVKKYIVRLSGEEREQLETLIRKGKSPARRVLKARILLKADVSEAGKGWSDNRIIEALETNAAPAPRVKAILYVRQSSTHQVMHNQESRLLQYAMRDRLCALARCAHGRTRLYRGRAAAAANAGFRASVITKPSSLVGSACLAIFEVLTAARKSRWRPDCLAGHVRFELRNVVTNYPFERSHRFAGIQPNSGQGDHSRLSCSAGDTQLGAGFCRDLQLSVLHGRWPSCGVAEKARIGRDLFRPVCRAKRWMPGTKAGA